MTTPLDTEGWTESMGGLDDVASATAGQAKPAIGRYRIVRKLGEGGMGVVWEGFDPELERRVAIKILRRADEVDGERLRREAKTLAKLSHPNVIAIHDVGEQDSELYVVMQLVDGITLDTRDRTAPALLVQAARGLAAAHAAGIVHRDFKPANVLVDGDGTVRVGDFGLALTADAQAGASFGGTPAYMAPEQLRARAVTPATDQFAFCVVLWEAVCGERPWAGSDVESIRRNIDGGRRRAYTGPRRLRAVLDRGLAIDPAARYPNMAALIRALEPRSRAPVFAIGGACVALATVAWLVRPGGDPCDGVDAPATAVWNAQVAAKVPARAAELLGARIDRWRAATVATCRATRAGELSAEASAARTRCLDRSLADASAAIDVLANGRDAQLAARAGDIASGGTDAADCSRATATAPADPALDAELATLTATFEAGRYNQVIERRAALEPRVTASPDPVARYRFWWDIGSAYRNLQDLAASKPAMRAAAEAATAAGDHVAATTAWSDLAFTSAQLGELRGVDDLLAMARAAADDKDSAQRVELTTGRVDLERGDPAGALAHCTRVDATPHTRLAYDAAGCRFDAELAAGHADAALALAKANLDDITSGLGPDHPLVLTRVQALAIAYETVGNGAAAEPLWTRLVDRYTALYGADSLILMEVLRSRAISETPGGTTSTPQALVSIERAVQIGEARLAPADPKRAALLETYVFVAGAQPHADKEQLAQLYDRAVAAYEKLDDPPGLARVLYNEADMWREDERCDRMLPLLRRVVKVLADAGRKAQTGAAALGGIGYCLGKDKQWAAAEVALVDAIAQHDAAGDVLFGGQDRLEYAKQLAARGKRDQGVAIAKRALADLAGKPPPADELRKLIEDFLK